MTRLHRRALAIGMVLLAALAVARWQWPQPDDARPPIAVPAHAESARTGSAIGSPSGTVSPQALPAQARTVLHAIRSGGTFPYRQDGQVFHNRERRLPLQARGWYREYTVPTPGARDRVARRIVAGGAPPTEFWYTDDHYRSFRRIAAGQDAP